MATLTEEETRKTRLHHPKKVGNLDGPIFEIIFKKPVPGAKKDEPWKVPKIEGREPGTVYKVSEDLAYHYVQVVKCAIIHAVIEPDGKRREMRGKKKMDALREEGKRERADQEQPQRGKAADRSMAPPPRGRRRE